MSDASKNGKKSQKGALSSSPFGQNERASEPYADIDVPDYDGKVPEATAPGAKADKAAKKAGSTSASSSASKKVAKDAAPAAPGSGERAEQAGKAARPGKAAGATANKPAGKSGVADKPAETAAAKKPVAEKDTAKKPVAETDTAKKLKPAKSTAKAPAAGGASAEKASAKAPTGTEPAEKADTEQASRPRDIYALAGRARPQRIEAPAPEPEPAAAEQADAPAQATEAGAEGEQKTEVLDLSGAANTPDGRAGQPQDAEKAGDKNAGAKKSAATATTGALAGAAGGYAAGSASQSEGAAPGGVAQESDFPQGSSVPGGAQGEFPAEGDPQWDPNAPVPADGDVAYGPDGEPLAPVAPVETRRGTQSLGLAILRIVAGAVLLITGLQTLFGLAGDPGISALESRLSFFSGSDILAVAIPAAEVVAGGLLILGLLTPFAAALAFVVSAFMATFHLSGHQGSLWPYGLNPVIHQWALYALISLSLIFTGPGGASLDRSRGWATRPLASAWIFAVLGVVGFAALWLLTGGRNPF